MLTALANHSRCCDLRKDTATYDAYGNLSQKTGTTQNDYGFAGEQFDSHVGQYYLRARYYDAGVGRFAGRDPFEGDMTNPLSLAKYPYVHGNPVNGVDPSGMFTIGEAFSHVVNTILETNKYFLGLLSMFSQSVAGALTGAGGALAGAGTSTLAVVPQAVNLTATISTGAAISVLFAKSMAELLVLMDVIEYIPGIPLLVWGNDIPETTEHTYEALRGEGQTLLTPGGITGFAPSFLVRRGDQENADRGWTKAKFRTHCTKAKKMNYEKNHPNAPVKAVCDEYPYASTWQGGRDNYDFTNRVSLKFVPDYEQVDQVGGHNPNNQANILDNFYNRGHVSKENLARGFFMVRANKNIAESYGYNRLGATLSLY